MRSITRLIRREGPITFDRFMEAALYDPEDGFFATGRGAGRAGHDFVTSPEVGSLFGACVARALDRLWHALDDPDPFLVVEAGAGTGRLARDVVRAAPACGAALRYVLVERSPVLRAAQRDALALEPPDEVLGAFVRRGPRDAAHPARGTGPVLAALDELPAVDRDGVVLANELLDDLPFGIARWDGERWSEARVALADGEGFRELLVPADVDPGVDVPPGTRVPIPRGMTDWFRECDRVLRRGYVLVIDYVIDAAELATRPWLRTYRAHGAGGDPLDAPGTQDITGDVVLEQLRRACPFPVTEVRSQAEWLRDLGIDELVERGQRTWARRAHLGDVEALAGRSRVSEAAALTDPAGLGAHRVVLCGKSVR